MGILIDFYAIYIFKVIIGTWTNGGLSKVATDLWLENWKKKPMSTESGTTWGDQNPGIHRLMSLSKGRVNGDPFYLTDT